jgi:2-polyprenyl-3-methyl-5-hydroxy-6-metoxy-1,4-benzoquinol methylase
VTVDIARFRTAYRDAVRDVLPFITPDRQRLIARHDPSLSPERHDFAEYLGASEGRYATALSMFQRSRHDGDGEPRVLDIGGFLGAFPLALARLGIPVTMAERLEYYGGAFDDLIELLHAESVRVWDADLTERLAGDPGDRYTLVTSMAMVEHLAHSPRMLLENARGLLAEGGRFVVEIPNIAYWPKRVAALRGGTVHPALRDVYDAAVPYIGHHREYTAAELRDVLEWSGFEVLELSGYNYSWNFQAALPARLKAWILYRWPMLLFRSCREVHIACARPASYQAISERPRSRSRRAPSHRRILLLSRASLCCGVGSSPAFSGGKNR